MSLLHIIGRAEKVFFTGYPGIIITAKIDTGADVSSIWISGLEEDDDGIHFCLFDEPSEQYDGKLVTVKKGNYRQTRIANSFGITERRYVAELEINVLGQVFTTEFTLANRSAKTYPMLLGRSLLADRFLVDVTKGEPLLELENIRAKKLKEEL